MRMKRKGCYKPVISVLETLGIFCELRPVVGNDASRSKASFHDVNRHRLKREKPHLFRNTPPRGHTLIAKFHPEKPLLHHAVGKAITANV